MNIFLHDADKYAQCMMVISDEGINSESDVKAVDEFLTLGVRFSQWVVYFSDQSDISWMNHRGPISKCYRKWNKMFVSPNLNRYHQFNLFFLWWLMVHTSTWTSCQYFYGNPVDRPMKKIPSLVKVINCIHKTERVFYSPFSPYCIDYSLIT